ncbi:MAG: hypothetical protein ACKVHO_12935 [Verrucomicrobiia bacterium]|jgi:hypothetical protein
MPKNRKKTAAPVKFGPIFQAIAWCVFICVAGVGYVWQKNQIQALGVQMKKHELKVGELKVQNEARETILAGLRSPAYLEERIKSLQLGLGMPSPNQVITLPEYPRPDQAAEQMTPSAQPQFARTGGVVQQASASKR